MPEYNFDEYIDRTGSNSIKHAFKKSLFLYISL